MRIDDRREEINGHLAELRLHYNRLRRLIPHDLVAKNIPASELERQTAVTAIHLIILSRREVEKLLRAASLEGVAQAVDEDLLRFYRRVVEPAWSQLQGLFIEMIGMPNVDIDLRHVRSQRDAT